MGAKARTPLKAMDNLVNDLKRALGLKPLKASLKYTGTLDVDNEGGWNLSGKASADVADVITLVGGVPVKAEAEAGLRGQHDNQGSADWSLEVEFG